MRDWLIQRYVHHKPTVELIHSAASEQDKEVIAIVGMLDVDDNTFLALMRHTGADTDHLLACRDKVKGLLHLVLSATRDQPDELV